MIVCCNTFVIDNKKCFLHIFSHMRQITKTHFYSRPKKCAHRCSRATCPGTRSDPSTELRAPSAPLFTLESPRIRRISSDSPRRRTACRCTSSSPGRRCRGTTQSFYTADSSSAQPSERRLRNRYRGSARADRLIRGRKSLLCWRPARILNALLICH